MGGWNGKVRRWVGLVGRCGVEEVGRWVDRVGREVGGCVGR